jgi:hypothetical protein
MADIVKKNAQRIHVPRVDAQSVAGHVNG